MVFLILFGLFSGFQNFLDLGSAEDVGDEFDKVHLLLDSLILQVVVNDGRHFNDTHHRHDDDRQQRNIENGAEVDADHRGDAQPADIVHQLVDRPPHRPRWPDSLPALFGCCDAESQVSKDEDDGEDEKPQHLLPPLNER